MNPDAKQTKPDDSLPQEISFLAEMEARERKFLSSLAFSSKLSALAVKSFRLVLLGRQPRKVKFKFQFGRKYAGRTSGASLIKL